MLPTLTGQEATFEINCAQAPQAAQELREVMLQRQVGLIQRLISIMLLAACWCKE